MSYQRKREENRRLKKLYEKTWHSYGAGAWYDEERNRYVKYSCHNKWLKLHCRRMTRKRMKNRFCKSIGCSYKKFYDYWWELL